MVGKGSNIVFFCDFGFARALLGPYDHFPTIFCVQNLTEKTRFDIFPDFMILQSLALGCSRGTYRVAARLSL